jgi:hypothetical protein
MPEYRAYILDRKGKIQSFEPLICVAVDQSLGVSNRHVTKLDH